MKFAHQNFVWCVFVFGALLVLNGCGEAMTNTPAPVVTAAPTRSAIVVPSAAPGWKLYTRSTYQLALPENWQEVKLQEEALRDAVVAAQDRNPPLAEQLRVLLESGQYKGFIFYAVENNSAPIARTVSIARSSLPQGQSLGTLAQTYAKSLPDILRGANLIEMQAPLKINGMDAASFVYDVSLVDANGKLTTLRGMQFLYVLASGDAYLVTITGDAADAENFMPRARQIGASFVAMPP